MRYAYYIYYRIDPVNAPLARERVHGLIARVQSATAAAGRLLCKRDECNLWMEVYDEVEEPAAFEAALAEAARAEGIDALLAPGSARKLECFLPCA